MDYLWDTPVLLHFLRESDTYSMLEVKHKFFDTGNFTTMSIISMGEILSLSMQFGWGEKKKKRMEEFLSRIALLSIDRREILDAYAEIDCFSQSKHSFKSLPFGMTARKMGKNDIWIAATAHVCGASFRLVTSDNDFNHLDGHFINLIKF